MSIDSLIALSTLGFDALHKFGIPSDNLPDYVNKLVSVGYLKVPKQEFVVDLQAVSDFIGTAAQCHFLATWCDRKCPVVRCPWGQEEVTTPPVFQGPLVFEIGDFGLELEGKIIQYIYYSTFRTEDRLMYRIALGNGIQTVDEVTSLWRETNPEVAGIDRDPITPIMNIAKRFLAFVSQRYVVNAFQYERYPMKKSKYRKLQDKYRILPKLAKVLT